MSAPAGPPIEAPRDRWAFLAVLAEDLERLEKQVVDRVNEGDSELSAGLLCRIMGARLEAVRLALRGNSR